LNLATSGLSELLSDTTEGGPEMAKRRKTDLPKTRTPEEWQAFFKCINTRFPTAARNHALLYLTYLAGLRIGEALALNMRDVDFRRLKVHVRDGKSGERFVPLPDDPGLAKTLERWLEVRAVWSPATELLFVTRTGRALGSSAVRRSMDLYGRRTGIGHVTPHMLRHSAATEMLANGAPPIGVQRVLGHRSLQTTLQTYAHASDRHAAEAMMRRFRRRSEE
jgi:integrase/recombinase XerC